MLLVTGLIDPKTINRIPDSNSQVSVLPPGIDLVGSLVTIGCYGFS